MEPLDKDRPQAGKFSVKVGAGTIKRKTLSLERNSLDYDVKQHGDQSILYSSTDVSLTDVILMKSSWIILRN